jgi:small-conductance mechanosensitive channel/CRP-like cAMP-binding protein
MDHTPLQSLFMTGGLNGREAAFSEGLFALGAVLFAIALRRRRWFVNAGTFLLLALGLVSDICASTSSSPGLSNWLAALALIFFFWGLVRLVVELIFRPRGRINYSTIPRDVVLLLLWLLVVAIVFYAELGFDVTKIFVSASLVSGAIGLALLEPLRNLFTGLTFHITKPFEPGDWVRFQNHLGYVKGTSWASTEIVTRANERVQIPNTMLVSQPVTNFRSEAIADEITIGISYEDSPGRVKEAVLRVVRDTPHVLADPPPQVYAWEYGEYAIKYRIRYYVGDYGVQETVRDTLVSSLWYALRRHAIDIPYPTQTLEMRQRPLRRRADAEFEMELISDLRRVDWLRRLSDEELRMLLPAVNVHQFGVGEVLMREDEACDSFYIVRTGTVEVTAKSESGTIHHVADISPESPHPFIGEGAFMSGGTRNATVCARTDVEVLEMSRKGFTQLFREYPEIAEPIAEIISTRGTERVGLLAEAQQQSDGTRSRVRRLLAAMRQIFDF